jgi:hypothetical protein
MIQTVSSDSLNLQNSLNRQVILGSKQTQALSVPFQSTTNNNMSLNYSVAPKAIISNEVYIKCTLNFVITAAVAAPANLKTYYGNGASPYCWSVRNLPLLWAAQNVNVKLNDQIFVSQVKDMMGPLSKMMSNQDALKMAGGCPSLPDQGYYNYSDAVSTLKNVNSGFQDATSSWVPRASYPVTFSTAAGDQSTTRCVFSIDVTIPLIAPPFFNPALEVAPVAMSNLSSINVDIVLDSTFVKSVSLPPSWSVAPNGNVFGASSNAASLLMVSNYAQDYFPYPSKCVIPNTLYDIKYQQFDVTATGVNGESSNLLQYDQYPDCFIWFFRKPIATQGPTDSDSYFTMKEGFSLSINGDSTLLNGYKKQQLYDIIKKYVNVTYNEFFGQVITVTGGVASVVTSSGSIYVVRPGIDLPISQAGVAPNQLYKIQLQFSNISLEPVPELLALPRVEMACITIRSGEITLSPSSSTQTSTLITSKDVVDAISKPVTFESEISPVEGGRLRPKTMHFGNGKAYGKAYGLGGSLPVGLSVPKQSSRF